MPPQQDIPPDWFREDGTLKGNGFFGPLQLPNGSVASEYSIADSRLLRDAHGNWVDYPSLVPTLTKEEVQAVLRAASDPNRKIPDAVYKKAEAFALERRAKGLPLFARPDEARLDLHPDLPRVASPAFVQQHYASRQLAPGSMDALSIAVGPPAESHTNPDDIAGYLQHGKR